MAISSSDVPPTALSPSFVMKNTHGTWAGLALRLTAPDSLPSHKLSPSIKNSLPTAPSGLMDDEATEPSDSHPVDSSSKRQKLIPKSPPTTPTNCHTGCLLLSSVLGEVMVDDWGTTFLTSGGHFEITLEDFVFLHVLGQGQYGTVYLARHHPTDTLMALKDIRIDSSYVTSNQLATELKILKRASRSAFVVDFYGSFIHRSSLFLCLEYMDLGSLEDVMTTIGKIPVSVLSAIAFSVLQGLHLINRVAMASHRDVKPMNILLRSDGYVKLCDFGVSSFGADSISRAGPGLGSVCYLAPECIEALQNTKPPKNSDKDTEESLMSEEQRLVNEKGDVWSLGVTLWELAVGKPLYRACNYDSPFAQLMSIMYDPDPTLPPDLDFPDDFKYFLEAGCLQKNVTKRSCVNTLLATPLIAPFVEGRLQAPGVVSQWIRSDNVYQRIQSSRHYAPPPSYLKTNLLRASAA